MFPRAPLVLLGFLVAAIVTILVLAELVSAHSTQRLEPLVLEISTKPAVMIQHVRVLDINSGQLSPPSCVLIKNGITEALYVEPVPPSVQVKDYTVLDGKDGVLMPALTDFHVHIGFSNGEPPWTASIFHPVNPAQEKESYIYAGVTTVVEGSVNPLPSILSGRETSSPNIFRTGKQITARGGHPHPMINALIPWPMNKYVGAKLTVQIEHLPPRLPLPSSSGRG